jgi:methylated-DNA-[protein]-cysteine S-methyltransferase
MIETARIDSPVGPLFLAAHEDRLIALTFSDGRDKVDRILARRFAEIGDDSTTVVTDPAGAVTALRAYFDGDVRAIDAVAADPGGSGFMRRAWEGLRAIPAGETISYAKLAVEAGSPNAIRAAGTACATNPIALVLPCHRVVRSDGTLGGYGGGLENKTWLLDHERRLTR